jgi:hypothetical protein
MAGQKPYVYRIYHPPNRVFGRRGPTFFSVAFG